MSFINFFVSLSLTVGPQKHKQKIKPINFVDFFRKQKI